MSQKKVTNTHTHTFMGGHQRVNSCGVWSFTGPLSCYFFFFLQLLWKFGIMFKLLKVISCLVSLSPQSNWHHVQAPEPEHHPGAAAELCGLSDAGGADRAASKLSLLTSQSLVPAHAGVWGALALPQPVPACCWASHVVSVWGWSSQTRWDRGIILIYFLLLVTTPQTGQTTKHKKFALACGSGPSGGQHLAMTFFLAESPGGRRYHMATDKEHTILPAKLAFTTDPLWR